MTSDAQIIRVRNKPKLIVLDIKTYEKLIAGQQPARRGRPAKADKAVKVAGRRGRPVKASNAALANSGAVTTWREKAGYTQVELARKVKMTQAAISRIESGKAAPREATLSKIAKALGCRPTDLGL